MGYGSIKCKCCRRTPVSTTLVAIGSKMFCLKCLKNVKVKATGRIGRYYSNVGKRCFISFMDKQGLDIQEFDLSEVIIGNRKIG